MAFKELPAKYYLTHFFEFLDFIEIHYQSVIADSHRQFIVDFRNLSEDAQYIYIHMVNRKGILFDLKSFAKYLEIQNFKSGLDELRKAGFIGALGPHNTIDFLYFLTKPRLYKWLELCGISVRPSLSRDDLIATGKKQLHLLDLKKISMPDQVVLQGQVETMDYLLFIYFGKIQKNLTLYTLRDLGIRQANTIRSDFRPRFFTKEHAESDYFFMKQLGISFSEHSKEYLLEVFARVQSFEILSSSTQILKDEFLFSFGSYFIDHDAKLALNALSVCGHQGARGKIVRQLYKFDKKKECLELLEVIQNTARSDEELLFAEDFLARKFNKKKVGRLTETLLNAQQITLSDFFLKRPELGVCKHYENQGYTASFCENFLWNSLFGVIFWDELFDSASSAIHNPFERSPSDLIGPEFYKSNLDRIETKLNLLKNVSVISMHILKVFTQNYGRLNDIFQWQTELAATLINFLKNSRNNDVASVLRSIAKDFETQHIGFPDVMIEKEGIIEFIEVKAEGDSLRANQLARMRLLKEAGFKVEILRVKWQPDPNQIYVVVDVETTGGSGSFHRVTEVGAVKIQNGKVIDEFQTLINPGRSIPWFITGITGITNEMVASAPTYLEIADKFLGFLDGAIFVAHNVMFDYGFIQREFSRAGINFVRAHLCTCAGMRKTHPGLKSYSLKNLTQHFQINLDQHHRALSDARAAAQLLLLINAKRRDPKLHTRHPAEELSDSYHVNEFGQKISEDEVYS